MSEPTPNPKQQELIEHTDGIVVVDAGAGTGKTFAITRRYAEIVDQPDVEPADVLLVTFTRSAATEMKERIVDHSTYSLRELSDASIQTFHSHCYDLLRERGHRAPTHLGIDERITDSTQIVDDDVIKAERFREFFDGFRDAHPEYAEFFRVLSDGSDLQSVIQAFASKGIIPTQTGWYRDSESAVTGDYDAFKQAFDEVNQPRNNGRKQSELREKLNGYARNKTYRPIAPSKHELRGDGTKAAPDATAKRAFTEDRSDLIQFVHDVYVEYLEFALSRNYVTFGLLQLFAFVLLCENASLRRSVSFEYVMIDEFQDSSEIQFKLALLLAGTNNLCVVGDWKQSIYSFQYADVRNIREFEHRLKQYHRALNDDQERVSFEPEPDRCITLTENYRSTQSLLEFSENALVTPASSGEAIDDPVSDDIVSLSSNAAFDNSLIEGFSHDDEHEAILSKLQEIVGNETYSIEDENGESRLPRYGDIAVFTRTRDYGRELLSTAEKYNFPMAYDGGVELFRSDHAKLLLAWLRILESNNDRGWAVVLEEAGYTLDEIKQFLGSEDYPDAMESFRTKLREMEAVGSVARRVFDRYGLTGEYADAILHTVQSVHDTSTLTRGDLIRFIEAGIEHGTEHEITTGSGVDSVTVRTIHTAKGLEYPIVVMANMNDGTFPPSGGGSPIITYEDPVGLRQRKQYADIEDHPHVYDNWTHDVLRHCLTQDYDEERRLLYVAITRAKNHVVFASGEDPNTFFEALAFDSVSIEPHVTEVERRTTTQAQLPFSIVPPAGPTGHTPHSLMDSAVFSEDNRGGEPAEGMGPVSFRGREFGSQIHDYAERYALGKDVSPSDSGPADEQHISAFIDSLPGELHVEERAVLPLTVNGEQITISGIVDLVHQTPEAIDIIDYKTDQTRRGEPEYRKQLSTYYHVLTECYPEKSVSASIFYTATGEQVKIDPLSKTDLKELIAELE